MLGQRSRHSETTAALGGVKEIPICQRQWNGKSHFEPKEFVFCGGVCTKKGPLSAQWRSRAPLLPPRRAG